MPGIIIETPHQQVGSGNQPKAALKQPQKTVLKNMKTFRNGGNNNNNNQSKLNRKEKRVKDKQINRFKTKLDAIKSQHAKDELTKPTATLDQQQQQYGNSDDDDNVETQKRNQFNEGDSEDDGEESRVQKPTMESIEALKRLSKLNSTLKHGGKPLLHRIIKFKESETLQDPNTLLKLKYKPINKPIHAKATATTTTTTTTTTMTTSTTTTTTTKTTVQQKTVVDENVLQPPSKVLFTNEKLIQLMGWKSVKKVGGGLVNVGNTCFMNSVLQCLTYSSPLTNFLMSKQHTSSCKVAGFCILCSLERHICRSIESGGRAIVPKELTSNLRKFAPGFRLGRQEDSHEFIRFVIEGCQKVCLSTHAKGSVTPRDTMTTVIGSIFGGYLQSQVKCISCGYESNTFDPFMDLSVDIHQCDSLTKALSQFVKVEYLDQSNKYKCAKCKKMVKASKQMTIHTSPSILTIQLKRFTWMGTKINKPILYEPVLDLNPYMTKKQNDSIYDLYGVLVHSGGTTNSGHYYCFIKSSSNVWHNMNDEMVSQVGLQTALNQRAYMLFYTKRNITHSICSQPTLKLEQQQKIQSKENNNTNNNNNLKRKAIEEEEEEDDDEEMEEEVEEKTQLKGKSNQKELPKQQQQQPQQQKQQQQIKIEKENVKKVKLDDSNGSNVKYWEDKSNNNIVEQPTSKQNIGRILSKKSQSNETTLFDANVAKWDDGQDDDEEISQIQKQILSTDSSLKKVTIKKDEYDEEMDRGRVKKIKEKRAAFDPSQPNQFNIISQKLKKQKDLDMKYGPKGTNNRNNFNRGAGGNNQNRNGNNYGSGKSMPRRNGQYGY